MYCAWRIPAHLRCTQCSILLHLMDICFLTCICLWQISQIQTFLFKVVGPGLVSTSPAFVSSSASHPAGPHGRHAQKTVNRAPIAGAHTFINTIPHKTSTTNRKATRKVRRLQPTQINITTEQVQTAIKNSKNNNSTGPDNINIKHLKNIGKNGLQYLTNIYNSAINDNQIPHVWKLANIIPIPKPNKDINIGTSYRPISLLSVIAKTLEKVILPYITQNIPNIPTQHGFKTKHSTNTALHNINNTVATGFNQPISTHTHHRSSVRHE